MPPRPESRSASASKPRPGAAGGPRKHQPSGLALDKVVLLGRTFEEYTRFFALEPRSLEGRQVLDVASGVSSFCAEANARGIHATACDPIYQLAPTKIQARCRLDLEEVVEAIGHTTTYRWDFYGSPEGMRRYRERACQTFLQDYLTHQNRRYRPGSLPSLPFPPAAFDLTLGSYLLFVYEHQFDYEFHQRAVLEIMRVTRGEARLYPLVNFEARRCPHVDALRQDPALRHLRFEEVATDFEFLANSNSFLRITHVPGQGLNSDCNLR